MEIGECIGNLTCQWEQCRYDNNICSHSFPWCTHYSPHHTCCLSWCPWCPPNIPDVYLTPHVVHLVVFVDCLSWLNYFKIYIFMPLSFTLDLTSILEFLVFLNTPFIIELVVPIVHPSLRKQMLTTSISTRSLSTFVPLIVFLTCTPFILVTNLLHP